MKLNENARFNFQACAIRDHSEVVKLTDSHHNLVFSATTGKVYVHLIDETDLENDNESVTWWSYSDIKGNVCFL